MRNTQVVRNFFKVLGKKYIFTNLYDNCRTVKAYVSKGEEDINHIRDDLAEFMKCHNKGDVKFSIKFHTSNRLWSGPSIIVRLPLE